MLVLLWLFSALLSAEEQIEIPVFTTKQFLLTLFLLLLVTFYLDYIFPTNIQVQVENKGIIIYLNKFALENVRVSCDKADYSWLRVLKPSQ